MYNPNQIELNILEFWEKNNIFDKLVSKNKGNLSWSFIDGPITANNPMGVHHAWGRTYKDLYQRWKAMQGFELRFQNGFDCQGLWVEVEVEKDLGLNSKKDIENFGIENFSLKCRERVDKYSKIQTQQSIRLGQWNHWDDSYYTLNDENIEHIWYFLKKCHEKGWLYQGLNSMPWCYRCGTSLSQHELFDSYKELSHISLYLRFPIKDRPKEYLLVWTTTPWTLAANVAVAVNPNLTYVRVKQDDSIYYLSEGTIKNLKDDYIVLDSFSGDKLVGLEYYGLFREFKAQEKVNHRVVAWKDVNEIEGTGIVHIAPGCGAEDYELGKREKLPLISPLDEDGNYVDGFNWLTGKNVVKVTKDIINDLEKRGFLYKTQDYIHRYPTCWRCGTELVFRLVKEWFISVDKIRPLMLETNKTINWQPEHVGKLMDDWLSNMSDWVISRKRYWGLPLPIWECKNNHICVIGTKNELIERAVSGIDQLRELHRPWIDNVKIKCEKCNQEMYRIAEVGDAWLDAGIVPFSTLNYLYEREYWKKWYPADLIIEMREQVRLWFYSLLFMSVTLENKSPYKNVFSYEKVNDELGRPMHKSLGNAIWFDDAAEKMGADVMRWIYCKQDPKFNLNFGYKVAEENKHILGLLFNLISYLEISMHGHNIRVPTKMEIEDEWMLSKLNNLIKEVTENLELLMPNIATKKLEDFFVFTLSRTYIQFIRDRVQSRLGKNKDAALYVLYISNLTLFKLLAPFMPFLTEHIYQNKFRNLEKKESIHLFDWPSYNESQINSDLENKFDVANKIIRAILARRNIVKIGVRWPLKEAVIVSKDVEIREVLKYLSHIIENQTNVKKVYVKDTIESFELTEFEYGSLYLDTKLTDYLEREGYSRELIRRIQNLRKKNGLKKEDRIELVINTNYNLSEYEEEIKDIAGASILSFDKLNKEYRYKAAEKVKNKEFEILFNIL